MAFCFQVIIMLAYRLNGEKGKCMFNKKRSVRSVLWAACVVLLFICVPVWGFMIATIKNEWWIWALLLGYVAAGYHIGRRFDNGGY